MPNIAEYTKAKQRQIRDKLATPIHDFNTTARSKNLSRTSVSTIQLRHRTLKKISIHPNIASTLFQTISAKSTSLAAPLKLRVATMNAAKKFAKNYFAIRTNPVVMNKSSSFYAQRTRLTSVFGRKGFKDFSNGLGSRIASPSSDSKRELAALGKSVETLPPGTSLGSHETTFSGISRVNLGALEERAATGYKTATGYYDRKMLRSVKRVKVEKTVELPESIQVVRLIGKHQH